MKKVFLSVAVIFSLSVFAFAESKINSTEKLSFGTVNEYSLSNGIKVYHCPKNENKINAVYFVVKGGTQVMDENFSGLETAVFDMMERGSKDFSYEEIKALKYNTLSSISSYSLYSGSVYTLSCIDYYLDRMLPVFIDGFMNPLFSEKEYEIIYQNLESQIAHDANDYENILSDCMRRNIYKNHPLLTSSSVKENSIKNITLENIKAHHQKILDASRIDVVAVGTLDIEKFIEKLNQTLGKIKASGKSFTVNEYPEIQIEGENVVLSHESCSGTALAYKVFASPSVKSDEYVAGQIAADIFSNTLFSVVRTKYGACYSPYSFISSSPCGTGFVCLYRMSDFTRFCSYVDEAEKYMLEGKVISSVTESEMTFDSISDVLDGYKNSYVNRKYSSLATSAGIASRITSSILQFDDIVTSDRIAQRAFEVSEEEIMKVFKKYWVTEKKKWFLITGPELKDYIKFE